MATTLPRRMTPVVSPRPAPKPQPTQKAQGNAIVSSHMRVKKEEMGHRDTHTPLPREFATPEPLAKIRIAVGQTYKVGAYESLRVDVDLTLPCEATPEGIRVAYEQGSDTVAELFQEESDKWLK